VSVEENKRLVARAVAEVINGGNLDAIGDLYAPEIAAAARDWVTPLRAAVPDVRMDAALGRHPVAQRLVVDPQLGGHVPDAAAAVEHQLCRTLPKVLGLLAPSAQRALPPWLAPSLEVLSRRGSLQSGVVGGPAVGRVPADGAWLAEPLRRRRTDLAGGPAAARKPGFPWPRAAR
jgi:hypothetical protein